MAPASLPLPRQAWRLGPHATAVLNPLGVDLDYLLNTPSRRPLLRACTDWSEQQHHLAGRLGPR